MRLVKQVRKAIKRLALGADDLPQQCVLALQEPQGEIAVELHGVDSPVDVTNHHVLACPAPFTVAIGFESALGLAPGTKLSLHFRERAGSRQLLGRLGLRLNTTFPLEGGAVHCLRVRECHNYCMRPMRLWARYLHWAYLRRWRPANVRLSMRDAAAMPVFFICPRPVALVSVSHGPAGNLFPMNLMGSLGDSRFAFALNSARPPASLVKRAGKLAVSSVSWEHGSLFPELGRNHKRESIDWEALPFPTRRSATLGLPVPSFALRVREMEVASAHNLGSHTLFLARTLHDERCGDGPQFFMVHGIYQAWRQRMRGRKHVAMPVLRDS